MRTNTALSLLFLLLAAAAVAQDDEPAEVVGDELVVGRPVSLFDGVTLAGWTTGDGRPVTDGWRVEEGAIHRAGRGGDIFWSREVGDFELTFEWKIVEGGNNGLKYRVRKYGGSLLGCEYQLLGETGRSLTKGSCGSLYALYEPNESKRLEPPGQWNSAKIVSHGPTIEHWLNGERIVEADLGTLEWTRRLARSKFAPHEDFARDTRGRIMLTDHGSPVWYRNLVLTPLPARDVPPLVPLPPPNVVVFLTDDQGTLDVGCYGSDDLHTPNMDRIARRGVRFTQAYSHTVCCPARALLLTGRHPQRSGVNDWTQRRIDEADGPNMSLEEITLAEALKSAGYRTAIFGKWHLGAAATHGPTKQGFDQFFGFRGGFIDNFNHHFLHGNGFHDLYRGTEEVFSDGDYFPDLIVSEANRFLEQNHDSSFFLYLPFNIPHYPEQPDSRFERRFRDLPMPRRSYAQMISTTDDRIGRVLSKLDELGVRDDTIVILLSDNGHSAEDYSIDGEDHASGLPKGTYYGAHGGRGNTGRWRGHKGTFFEGGIRVPAMISLPSRLPTGEARDQAISVVDFYPTILELCDVSPPAVELDGKSLLPIIRSPDAPTHHEVMHWQWQDDWAVRRGDWKLISRRGELFLGNLSDERPEMTNHADQQPELVSELRQLHDEWEDTVSASAVDRPNALTPNDVVTAMHSLLAEKNYKEFYSARCHKHLRDQIAEEQFVEYMKGAEGAAIAKLFGDVRSALKEGEDVLIARPQEQPDEFEFILVQIKEQSSRTNRQWHIELKKEDGQWKLIDTD